MFVLGKSSCSNLAGVHPDLVRLTQAAIQITTQDFSVTQGLRSLEEEAKHVADGTSRTMNSMHLVQKDGFGHAVDLVPWVDGGLVWSQPPASQWGFIYPVADAVRQAAIAINLRIRWGGVWDRCLNDLDAGPDALKAAVESYCTRHAGPDFLDGPHFEMPISPGA